MSAREDILQKVRTAIQDVTEENPTLDVPLSWSYGQPLATADVLADFVEKVRDYRATVVRVPAPPSAAGDRGGSGRLRRGQRGAADRRTGSVGGNGSGRGDTAAHR